MNSDSKEACDACDVLVTLVRGHYYCPIRVRSEQHWWWDGVIIDPTRLQSPSRGVSGVYTEFDGNVTCGQLEVE